MSTFQHTRNSVTAAIQNLASQGPVLHVQRVTPIGSNFARVLGTISAKATPDQIAGAIRKLSSKLTPIAGSFQAVASNGVTQSIEGIVGVIEERIVLSDNNREQFSAIASNMYMDEEERLWSLKKTEAGDILIKSHAGDDLEVMNSLMACVASSDVGYQESIPASNDLAGQRATVEGGDLITYVSPVAGRTVLGFAVASAINEDGSEAGLVVVDREDRVEQIDRNLVIASFQDVEIDETEELVAVAAGNFSMEMIKDYYRRMFIRRPEYFEKFWSRYSSHAFF